MEYDTCKFGTEYASNYLPIRGATLPRDKERILALIDGALREGAPERVDTYCARGSRRPGGIHPR